MRSVHSKHLLSLFAIPTIALTAFLAAQSSNAIRGDVNNDGQVTTVDALAVMSHVVGKPLPQGYTMVPNGDANGDGQITTADALVILSFVVGKDVSQFPVGKGIITVSINRATATVARGDTTRLTATVSGAQNTAVTWRTSAAGVATVSESGLVTGVAPGEATITAISQADTLARATARITVTQAAGSGLTIVSGNAQTATVGIQLSNALVVRVTDAQGNTVSGATVNWAVATGGGSITPQTSTTDANGQARGDVDPWPYRRKPDSYSKRRKPDCHLQRNGDSGSRCQAGESRWGRAKRRSGERTAGLPGRPGNGSVQQPNPGGEHHLGSDGRWWQCQPD
jgi:hypothetical protein